MLDAGALIAVDRADRRVIRLLELAGEVHVPAAVVAPLDGTEARAVGHLCGASGTADVVDASVALLARRVGGVVVTGDPDDLRAIDPGLDLVTC